MEVVAKVLTWVVNVIVGGEAEMRTRVLLHVFAGVNCLVDGNDEWK